MRPCIYFLLVIFLLVASSRSHAMRMGTVSTAETADLAELVSLTLLERSDIEQVERSRLSGIIQEQGFVYGEIAISETSMIGHLSGADVLLLFDSVSLNGGSPLLLVRLLHVDSTAVVFARLIEWPDADAVYKLADALSESLLLTLNSLNNASSAPVFISLDPLTLNSTRESGPAMVRAIDLLLAAGLSQFDGLVVLDRGEQEALLRERGLLSTEEGVGQYGDVRIEGFLEEAEGMNGWLLGLRLQQTAGHRDFFIESHVEQIGPRLRALTGELASIVLTKGAVSRSTYVDLEQISLLERARWFIQAANYEEALKRVEIARLLYGENEAFLSIGFDAALRLALNGFRSDTVGLVRHLNRYLPVMERRLRIDYENGGRLDSWEKTHEIYRLLDRADIFKNDRFFELIWRELSELSALELANMGRAAIRFANTAAQMSLAEELAADKLRGRSPPIYRYQFLQMAARLQMTFAPDAERFALAREKAIDTGVTIRRPRSVFFDLSLFPDLAEPLLPNDQVEQVPQTTLAEMSKAGLPVDLFWGLFDHLRIEDLPSGHVYMTDVDAISYFSGAVWVANATALFRVEVPSLSTEQFSLPADYRGMQIAALHADANQVIIFGDLIRSDVKTAWVGRLRISDQTWDFRKGRPEFSNSSELSGRVFFAGTPSQLFVERRLQSSHGTDVVASVKMMNKETLESVFLVRGDRRPSVTPMDLPGNLFQVYLTSDPDRVNISGQRVNRSASLAYSHEYTISSNSWRRLTGSEFRSLRTGPIVLGYNNDMPLLMDLPLKEGLGLRLDPARGDQPASLVFWQSTGELGRVPVRFEPQANSIDRYFSSLRKYRVRGGETRAADDRLRLFVQGRFLRPLAIPEGVLLYYGPGFFLIPWSDLKNNEISLQQLFRSATSRL